MRRLILHVCALAALAGIQAGTAHATVVVTSENLVSIGAIFNATGNVVASDEEAGWTLYTDKMLYNSVTSIADAFGNVAYIDRDLSLVGETGAFNLESGAVDVRDGYVFMKESNIHITGTLLKKTGLQSYYFENASFTTCDAPLPAWCVKGTNVDLIIGDRVTADDVSFNVRGVPVLYSPVFWAPVITDRKTGFLFPTMGYSEKKGAFIRQPFFWAMGENYDSTVIFDSYSRRGQGEGLEFRYLERLDVSGKLYGYHFYDSVLDQTFTEFQAVHEQGDDLFLNINLVNRGDYFRTFNPYIERSSLRFLESSGEINAPLENSRLYAKGLYYIDLKEQSPQARTLQRLPEIGYAFYPADAGPVDVSLTARAANFIRDKGERGGRLDAMLDASYSAGNSVVLTQSIEADKAYYQTRKTRPLEHQYAEYTADLKTGIERRYAVFRHVIEPEITAGYRKDGGDRPPFFDSLELPEPRSFARFGVTNRFIDLDEESVTIAMAEVVPSDGGRTLELDAYTSTATGVSAGAVYDHEDESVKEANGTVSFDFMDTELSLGERYTKLTEVMLHTFGIVYEHSDAFALAGKVWYDSRGDGLVYTSGEMAYEWQCWGLDVRVMRKPKDLSVFFSFSLRGLGSMRAGSFAYSETVQ